VKQHELAPSAGARHKRKRIGRWEAVMAGLREKVPKGSWRALGAIFAPVLRVAKTL